MPVHQFNDPADLAKGGAWIGDFGRRLCEWRWDAKSQKLMVTCGARGKAIELGGLVPADKPLADVLPRLALGAAHRIYAEQRLETSDITSG